MKNKRKQSIMPTPTYIEKATVTLSKNYHGDKVSFSLFTKVLQNCIDSLSELEAIKKTLFYGKELPLELHQLNLGVGDTEFLNEETSPNSCANLASWFKIEENGQVSIHGILGAAAETSELLTLLRAVVVGGAELPEYKLAEEMGDVLWYFAILCMANGFTFEQLQEINIAKLKARYPDGFKKFDALNRNVEAEEEAMKKVSS